MNDAILQCADVVPWSVFLWKLPEVISSLVGGVAVLAVIIGIIVVVYKCHD